MDKEWVERYVKIYKHFDLYQSFPFEKKDDIEWLFEEMRKKKNGFLTKEKEDLFEYLNGFDWGVYDIVMKERKKEDDQKLGFEFEIRKSSLSSENDDKLSSLEDNMLLSESSKELSKKAEEYRKGERVLFEWEYDEDDNKYPFRDRDGEIYLRVKIKNPWIEEVRYSYDTHYYLFYENKRVNYFQDEEKTTLEYATMMNLFEYKNLSDKEKRLLKIEDKTSNRRYRLYQYLCVPIYTKNQVEKKDNKREEANELFQRLKIKKDMNLFLKDYFLND